MAPKEMTVNNEFQRRLQEIKKLSNDLAAFAAENGLVKEYKLEIYRLHCEAQLQRDENSARLEAEWAARMKTY